MAEDINVWLAIILTTISIISALCGGLIFIWRLGGKFSSTLTNLDTSINQLNTHLIRVDSKADETAHSVRNHEIRLVIIERELNIEGVVSPSESKTSGAN